jgi:Fungal specific transcription factor domain.
MCSSFICKSTSESKVAPLTLRQIGQALRMAQTHGLHTDMQANAGGDELVCRCRRIWWTVYTLDRKFSSSMGVPNSLHDEDVTAPLPKANDDDNELNTARVLYVKICQLQGRVISSTFGPSRDLMSLTSPRSCL